MVIPRVVDIHREWAVVGRQSEPVQSPHQPFVADILAEADIWVVDKLPVKVKE